MFKRICFDMYLKKINCVAIINKIQNFKFALQITKERKEQSKNKSILYLIEN